MAPPPSEPGRNHQSSCPLRVLEFGGSGIIPWPMVWDNKVQTRLKVSLLTPYLFFRIFLASQRHVPIFLRLLAIGPGSLPNAVTTPLAESVIIVGNHSARKWNPLYTLDLPLRLWHSETTPFVREWGPNIQTLFLWPHSEPLGWSGGELTMSFPGWVFLDVAKVRAVSSAQFGYPKRCCKVLSEWVWVR